MGASFLGLWAGGCHRLSRADTAWRTRKSIDHSEKNFIHQVHQILFQHLQQIFFKFCVYLLQIFANLMIIAICRHPLQIFKLGSLWFRQSFFTFLNQKWLVPNGESYLIKIIQFLAYWCNWSNNDWAVASIILTSCNLQFYLLNPCPTNALNSTKHCLSRSQYR